MKRANNFSSDSISRFHNCDPEKNEFDPFANRKLQRPTTYIFFKFLIIECFKNALSKHKQMIKLNLTLKYIR